MTLTSLATLSPPFFQCKTHQATEIRVQQLMEMYGDVLVGTVGSYGELKTMSLYDGNRIGWPESERDVASCLDAADDDQKEAFLQVGCIGGCAVMLCSMHIC